jgi:DNA/RNA endonuclease G (NUC1)
MPSIIPRPLMDRLAHLSYARAFDIFLRSLDIVDRALAEYRLEVDKPEFVIRPAVQHIELFSKVDVRAVTKLGEQAAEAVLAEMKKYFAWRSRLRRALSV